MSEHGEGVARSPVDGRTAAAEPAFHTFQRRPPRGEEFLLRLLKNLPGMAYRCRNDPDWTMEFVSDGCRDLTGFAPTDLVDNGTVSYGDLIHPDDRARVWAGVQDAVVEGAPFEITYRIRRVDGRERTVWEQGSAVLGADGDVLAIEGFVTDVTDYARLTHRVKDQESQFRALVEQSIAGVYIIGDGRFRYVNPRFAEIFGYSVEEILGLGSVGDLVQPEDRDLVLDNLRLRFEGRIRELHYEFRGRQKDGGERVVEVHGRRIELDGASAVIGTLLDVTERKRTERRYHEAQKLEALGRLATGVAHDLNNFLSVVKTTAELLMAERAADAGLVSDLEGIVSAVERGTALSRQLTAFGNPRPTSRDGVSMPQLITDVAPILERMLGDHVDLCLCVDAGLPPVALDPVHAEELVVNLAVNARDAMGDGGTLTVRAYHPPERAADGTVRHADGVDSRRVVLEFTDTGVGMPPEVRSRVFEPYFTTKGERGTGLGLANVWRIVSDVGGLIELESEPGAGSTFRLSLPVARAER
jgi:PAS domain S-box-containing protein